MRNNWNWKLNYACYLSATFFPSKFLYDLTRNDGTNPISIIVWRWIEWIQQHLRISIRYTERLHTVLVKRANYLKKKVRSLTGGAPRQRFYQQSWKLQLHPGEIEPLAMKQQIQTLEQEVSAMRDEAADLSEQVSTLQSKNKKLESKVCSLSEKLGKGGECATRYRSHSEYSESHKRRLKQAVQSIARTLYCGFSRMAIHHLQ